MASSKIALGVFLGLSAYGLLHSYHNFDALYYTASDWMIGLVEPPKPAVQQVSYQVPGSPRLSLGPVPDSSRFSEPSTGSSLAPQCIKPGNVIDQDSLFFGVLACSRRDSEGAVVSGGVGGGGLRRGSAGQPPTGSGNSSAGNELPMVAITRGGL
jgi:hypothetical protein